MANDTPHPGSDPARLRREYGPESLSPAEMDHDPITQFQAWFAQAAAAPRIVEPNAMTLATATAQGRPSARTVLLKGVDARGFAFYTNATSRKGRELAENPYAALVFRWDVLERQVCVTGSVAPLPEAESDAYFASRPRGAQLGAWASAQSTVIADRAELDRRFAVAEARFAGQDVTRPHWWGGFVLSPIHVEFWQGRPDRLHDRLRYQRNDATPTAWTLHRLSP